MKIDRFGRNLDEFLPNYDMTLGEFIEKNNVTEDSFVGDAEIRVQSYLSLLNWKKNPGLKDNEASDDVMVKLWHDVMFEWMCDTEFNHSFNSDQMVVDIVDSLIYCLQGDLKSKFDWATGIYTSNLLNILNDSSCFTVKNEECIYVLIDNLLQDCTRYVDDEMTYQEKFEFRRHISNLFRVYLAIDTVNRKKFILCQDTEVSSGFFAKRKYLKSYGQTFQKYTKNWNVKYKCEKNRNRKIYPYFSMSNEWIEHIKEYIVMALGNTSVFRNTILITKWIKKCFEYGFNDYKAVLDGFDEYIWHQAQLVGIQFVDERIDLEALVYDGVGRDEAEEYMPIDEDLKTKDPKKYQKLVDNEYEFYEYVRINLGYIDREQKYINTIVSYRI